MYASCYRITKILVLFPLFDEAKITCRHLSSIEYNLCGLTVHLTWCWFVHIVPCLLVYQLVDNPISNSHCGAVVPGNENQSIWDKAFLDWLPVFLPDKRIKLDFCQDYYMRSNILDRITNKLKLCWMHCTGVIWIFKIVLAHSHDLKWYRPLAENILQMFCSI